MRTPFLPALVPQFVPHFLLLLLFINYSVGAAELPELPGSGAAVPCGWEFIYCQFYWDVIIAGNIFCERTACCK